MFCEDSNDSRFSGLEEYCGDDRRTEGETRRWNRSESESERRSVVGFYWWWREWGFVFGSTSPFLDQSSLKGCVLTGSRRTIDCHHLSKQKLFQEEVSLLFDGVEFPWVKGMSDLVVSKNQDVGI